MTTPSDFTTLGDAWSVLIEERHMLQRSVAGLTARYGPFGTFEHERKTLLAVCSSEVRLGAVTKLTEAAIDEMARNHPDYRTLIERAYDERTQLAVVEADLLRLSALIERTKSEYMALTKLAGVV